MDPKIAHLWIILKNNTERPVRSVVAQRMNFTMKKKLNCTSRLHTNQEKEQY